MSPPLVFYDVMRPALFTACHRVICCTNRTNNSLETPEYLGSEALNDSPEEPYTPSLCAMCR